MVKKSETDQLVYAEKVKLYQTAINAMLKWEIAMREEIQKDGTNTVVKKFDMVDGLLNLMSYYIIQSNLSQVVLKKNNEEALSEARKTITKCIACLEDMVTGYVDAPFSDYEDKHLALEAVDGNVRYYLIRKIGLSLQLLENAFGDNTKWRWSFVDLEGRFVAVAKNIFDMKKMVVNMDPRSQYYKTTIYHLRMIKRLLIQAADRYRERYEMSTNSINDFQKSLNFMSALYRIHVLLGESAPAEMLRKKIDAWEDKLNSDLKKLEEGKEAVEK